MIFSLDQYCAEVKGSSYIWIYLPNTILMYLLIFCSDWRHAVRNINTIGCLIGTGLGLDWDRRSGNFWFVRKRQTSTLICMPWSKDIDIICVYSSKSSMFISVKLSLLIEWLVFFSVAGCHNIKGWKSQFVPESFVVRDTFMLHEYCALQL